MLCKQICASTIISFGKWKDQFFTNQNWNYMYVMPLKKTTELQISVWNFKQHDLAEHTRTLQTPVIQNITFKMSFSVYQTEVYKDEHGCIVSHDQLSVCLPPQDSSLSIHSTYWLFSRPRRTELYFTGSDIMMPATNCLNSKTLDVQATRMLQEEGRNLFHVMSHMVQATSSIYMYFTSSVLSLQSLAVTT